MILPRYFDLGFVCDYWRTGTLQVTVQLLLRTLVARTARPLGFRFGGNKHVLL